VIRARSWLDVALAVALGGDRLTDAAMLRVGSAVFGRWRPTRLSPAWSMRSPAAGSAR